MVVVMAQLAVACGDDGAVVSDDESSTSGTGTSADTHRFIGSRPLGCR